MAVLTVEERVTILEREMAELKQGLMPVTPKKDWIAKVAGSFNGDPEFGEILRLGREIRKSEKPGDTDGDA